VELDRDAYDSSLDYLRDPAARRFRPVVALQSGLGVSALRQCPRLYPDLSPHLLSGRRRACEGRRAASLRVGHRTPSPPDGRPSPVA
jgi:hypothetical protein